MLVTTHSEGNKDTFLFDTGVTIDGVLHNLDVLQVKPNEMHAIVLSHGHTDHTRGLIGLIKRYGRPRIPIVLHPDAFLKEKTSSPTGTRPSIFRRASAIWKPRESRSSKRESRRCWSVDTHWLPGKSRERRPSKKAARRKWPGSTASGNPIRGFTTTRP